MFSLHHSPSMFYLDEAASRDASASASQLNEHQAERQLLDIQKDLATAIIEKNEVRNCSDGVIM